MTVPAPFFRHVSTFSGIGGIDLAADRAGFRTVAFVEQNPFCQSILAKHWPEVPIYDDISTFEASPFRGCELVSGGFPCQDVSVAGKQSGVEAARTGLFRQLLRIVCEVGPDFVLLENVAGLITGGGISNVLGALAQMGFDAIWGSPTAASVGAPHERQRVFIVAHPSSKRYPQLEQKIADAYKDGRKHSEATSGWHLSELSSPSRGVGGIRRMPPPGIVRMVDGVPAEVDLPRFQALGNAVNPQTVFPILTVMHGALVDALGGCHPA